MKVSKLFTAILLGATALGLGTGNATAVCNELGGFALFQCADLAYFQQPPGPPPVLDANGVVANVSARFWQIGFGNELISSGGGSTGTGNAGPTNFNGNDAGLWQVELTLGTSIDPRFPPGVLCLRNNNYGNGGIDGCCNNDRTAALNGNRDESLNPYFDQYVATFGTDYLGYYSRDWIQDYPTAILLKTADSSAFALSAVASMDRGNTGTGENGPCYVPGPGSNPAPCDFRTGFYQFKDVTNGLSNPVTGANNVIPWQPTPRPMAACVAGCSGTTTNRTINFQWAPAVWHHDGTIKRSSNPAMGGDLCTSLACNPAGGGVPIRDLTRSTGVGMKDLLTKVNATNNWAGLARYDLESAAVTAGNILPGGAINFASLTFAPVAGQVDIPQPGLDANGNPTGMVSVLSLDVVPDTCFRVRTKVGKKPETAALSVANCRLGRCGDRGYEVVSTAASTITCIGGPLASEQATNVVAKRAKGSVSLTWDMTSELSVIGFDVYAENLKGQSTKLGSVSCQECSSGAGASYLFESPLSGAKGGVKLIRLEVISATPQTVRVPLQ